MLGLEFPAQVFERPASCPPQQASSKEQAAVEDHHQNGSDSDVRPRGIGNDLRDGAYPFLGGLLSTGLLAICANAVSDIANRKISANRDLILMRRRPLPRSLAVSSSRRRYRGLEDVRVLAVVIAELKLCHVERQILLRHFVEGADDTALNWLQKPSIVYVRIAPTTHCSFEWFTRPRLSPLMYGKRGFSSVASTAHAVRDTPSRIKWPSVAPSARFCTRAITLPPRSTAPTTIALPVHRAGLDACSCAGCGPCRRRSFVHSTNAQSWRNGSSSCRRGCDGTSTTPSVRARSHHPMNLKGADAFLAGHHQVNDLEPNDERDVGVLEDRPDEHREAIAFGRARMALPVVRLARQFEGSRHATARARHAIGPAAFGQVQAAGVLGREARFQLRHRHLLYESFRHRPILS